MSSEDNHESRCVTPPPLPDPHDPHEGVSHRRHPPPRDSVEEEEEESKNSSTMGTHNSSSEESLLQSPTTGSRSLKTKLTPPSSPDPNAVECSVGRTVDVGQPMEIDAGNDEEEEEEEEEEELDDVDADLERLLGNPRDKEEGGSRSSRTKHPRRNTVGCGPCCRIPAPQPHAGTTKILFPETFRRTGWGMMGPHWFGPLCVLLILLLASEHFIREATHIGMATTVTCAVFCLVTITNLISVSFRDPGIVTPGSHPPEKITNPSEWRWCDLCNCAQPPDGQHCPDCNVCVEGYDHHCVWMGTCIGKKNMKHFVRFNLSWLVYLLYALVWVSFLGPHTV